MSSANGTTNNIKEINNKIKPQENPEKEKSYQRIERALKNNLKKRKLFQDKIKKKQKTTNEPFIRPLD